LTFLQTSQDVNEIIGKAKNSKILEETLDN